MLKLWFVYYSIRNILSQRCYKLNIYDTKTISCAKCKKDIGEVDYDSQVIRPLCGYCANPLPEGDTSLYAVSAIKSAQSKRQEVLVPAWPLSIALIVEALW